jgi:hypothetical protein
MTKSLSFYKEVCFFIILFISKNNNVAQLIQIKINSNIQKERKLQRDVLKDQI